MMWVDYFKYEFCVVCETLFIKGRTENNRSETAFMLPIGALPTDEAVGLIFKYCYENGISPVFSAVPEDRIDVLLGAMQRAEVESLEDWTDYIYDIQALASFSGKQLAKKRNHFNQFVNSNPGWYFESISGENIEEARCFVKESYKATDASTQLSDYEHNESCRVLENYDKYPFEGIVLRCADGTIAALAVGEVIGDTLFVHIEKMNHSLEGSGAAICRLFSGYMHCRHTDLRYVNREEDCGDVGLRNAKEQYHPLARLKKFNVRKL